MLAFWSTFWRQIFGVMMASAQVVETSVNTNNSPSQDYTTNPDDHSNHNIDSTGFKPFTVMRNKEVKVSLYVDDTTLLLPGTGEALRNALAIF